MANEQIEIFKNTITEQLLGPGSDADLIMGTGIIANDNQHEVITDFPLRRYYTGILFPNKILKDLEEQDTQILDDSQLDNDMSDKEHGADTQNDNSIADAKDNETIKKDVKDDSEEEVGLSNHFHPTDMGISFCVDESVKFLTVRFSFATYSEAKQTDVSVEMSPSVYNILIDERYGFPFKDIVSYKKIDEKNGYLFLNREIKGKKKERKEEYKEFDDWKNNISKDYREILRLPHQKFNKLITRLWKRKPISITESIDLKESINTPHRLANFSDAGYTLKTYVEHNRKYIKIQLVNLFASIAIDKFSNSKEQLNTSCLFQAQISVESDKLQSYKPYDANKSYADKEKQQLDFLYRQVTHFSVGHNCSASWQPLDTPSKVNTTFLPTYDLKDTKPNIDGVDGIPLYALSIWGDDQKTITGRLESFIAQYANWIDQQKQSDGAKEGAGKTIVQDLDETLNRLKEGVRLLQKDNKLFKAFQYTNTAMLLQFSLKDNFYQQLQEINLRQKPPLFNEQQRQIAYRPFQLAFLLLSLESTTNPQSQHRKNFVDLIWFSTGGGKTEAYLAVAALTIIWRRSISEQYQGVAVIMRYTLRLLTAQQFERASKLITVLDYLRQKFEDELKDEPISIGLWIGQSSTPNTLKDAEKAIKNITEKGKEANKFQIDTCPWCGSELIQGKNGRTYPHAFDLRMSAKDLKIKCLNAECHFSKGAGLPVQVVDEVAYHHPPTLLFATIDKMAMLSWKEEGHVFFNSLENEQGLPPELIIQDELHLLTGPLGSLVGLFETVIESLCTKDNHIPKIIASTATTRNTSEQVKQLYGNRKVNIFPPSGLTYDDSFFFKQDNNSKRKYLGFMPTGKTGVDSQIHLLTTLFIARLKIYLADEEKTDPYWTLVSYYNSLKDVGRMSNKVGDEIQTFIKQVQERLRLNQKKNNFNHFGLKSRTRELTSRIDGAKIKQNLSQLEKPFVLSDANSRGYRNVERDVVDLVLATNMLSVGIDIDRLNMMLINGMPRNIAEYIQASSRIGREHNGLVVAFSDSNRARDKSYFEHFLSFHQSLYKQIEPLSITPFTENTIDKMIASVMICYMRHKKKNLNKNTDVKWFKTDDVESLKVLLKNRFPNDKYDE